LFQCFKKQFVFPVFPPKKIMAAKILDNKLKSNDGYEDELDDNNNNNNNTSISSNDKSKMRTVQEKTKEKRLKMQRRKSHAELELRQMFFSDPGSLDSQNKRNSWKKNSDSFQFQLKPVDWNEEFQQLLV